MLRDEVDITVRSGNGGAGCASFRREKYIPEGGPDGGDGGDGGDVVLIATRHRNTLNDYARKRHWKAAKGQQGMGSKCHGRSGEDLELLVPCGTLVRLADTGEIIADLVDHGQRVVVAPGGRGGRGNVHFKSSTNQVPRRADPGEPGVSVSLKLELKLLADVGIIGLPNAGKSTLLSRLSQARPKIGNYPFTTLEPQLGVIERADRSLVLADIPGLIEGAAEGVGLGHRFLRHVERCALLLHLVDGSQGEVADLVASVELLDRELGRFSPALTEKPQLLVLNKLDTRQELAELAREVAAATGRETMAISGVSGAGLRELESRLLSLVPGPRSD